MTEDGHDYPDGLTPGERRVLDYVRIGTLDAETAVRLGLGVGEVKERVNRIVSKMGLRDRSQLVTATTVESREGPAATPTSWARPTTPGEYVIDFSAEEPEEPVIDFSDAITLPG